MKVSFKAKSKLEKFGEKVYSALVENFPQTFFVGGMVRDLLINRKIGDIDIATNATPNKIEQTLSANGISFTNKYAWFGSIKALGGNKEIIITTFRKDLPTENRYPKTKFLATTMADSLRRDFTINALYFSLNKGEILDFHNGLKDLKLGLIRFIGNPKNRITEDPLRIIRALRFALVLSFKLETKTKLAIKNNFAELKNLTKSKTEKEIVKIADPKKRKILKLVIAKPKMLDKYFK